MYLSVTIIPPEDTHNRRLMYKQIINDNIPEHSFNNIKFVFIAERITTEKYCTLIKMNIMSSCPLTAIL